MYTNKDYRLLASSVKKPYNKTSNYGIYYHKSKDIKENVQIGKVRGNFMGTEFHIFNPTRILMYDTLSNVSLERTAKQIMEFKNDNQYFRS